MYNYIPSIEDINVVDETYFNLSKEYREAQAELNGYLHQIQTAIQQNQIEVDQEYIDAYNKYVNESEKLNQEFSIWKKKELKKIDDLKIIIPNNLKETYDEVQKLTK